MKSVLVRPRKFTYLRRLFATTEHQMYSITREVEENQVAHAVFLTTNSEGMQAQFFEITESGRSAAIAVVGGISKIDDGVVVSSE